MAILVVRLSIAKIMYQFYELMSRLVRGEETAKKKSMRNCSYRDRVFAAVAAYVHLQNQTSTGGVTLDFWAPFSEGSVIAFWNNVPSAYGNATGNTVRVSIYSGDEFFTKNNHCPRKRFASRPIHLRMRTASSMLRSIAQEEAISARS